MNPKPKLHATLAVITLAAATHSFAANGIWSANADGNWSDSANWDSATVAGGADFTATFPDIITLDRVVTLTGPVTIGNISFQDLSNNLTLTGSDLTLDVTTGSPELGVTDAARQLTIGGALVSADGLKKTGSGTALLKTMQSTLTGNISVEGGTLFIGASSDDDISRRLGSGNFAGNIDIASGATFKFWTGVSEAQEFSGDISGGGNLTLAYKGNYTLSGDNTYGGKTIVHGEYNGNTATLNVASFNSVTSGSMVTGMGTVATPVTSSSLGVPSSAANGTVDIGRAGTQANAILNYTGLGETTDRVMNLLASGSSTKTVNNLGSGPLVFTQPWTGNSVLVFRVPITTDSDMSLTGSLPGNPNYLEKRGNAKLSLQGACNTWGYVRLYAGTLQIDSEINDGGVYTNLAIATGSGNGGTNFIAVPAGTPLQVGMTVAHARLAVGTTILSIVDINANPVVAEVSSNSDATNRTEAGSIGFAGALGMMPAGPSTTLGLRWRGDATLKYDGPDDTSNRGFIIDNGFTSTWEIKADSTLALSGNTTATTGKINKSGTGTLALSGTLLHTGTPNTVSAGTLLINGNASAMTGEVQVAGAATFGGTGTIGGALTVADTGKLAFDLGTTPGTHNKLDVTGAVSLPEAPAASVLTITATGGATTGTYTLLTATGGITGDVPATVNLPGGWTANPPQIIGNDLVINITSTGGSPYDTWATGSEPFDGDANGDGVDDGLAWLLGAATPSANASDKLPIVANPSGFLTLAFNRVTPYAPAKLYVEYGNNLTGWTKVGPIEGDATLSGGIVVEVNEGSPDGVLLKLPTSLDGGGGKLFTRLRAEEN